MIVTRAHKYVAVLAVVIVAATALSGCVTAPASHEPSRMNGETSGEHPQWLTVPPMEEGYFFGVGSGSSRRGAEENAFVNVAQQFRTRLFSTLIAESIVEATSQSEIIVSLDRQLTDVDVIGAKIYDQYVGPQGEEWILVRAPIDCVLDATESVLLSYRLDLQRDVEEIFEAVDQVERTLAEEEPRYIQGGNVRITGSALAEFSEHNGNPRTAGTVREGIKLFYRDRFSREEFILETDRRGQITGEIPGPGTYSLFRLETEIPGVIVYSTDTGESYFPPRFDIDIDEFDTLVGTYDLGRLEWRSSPGEDPDIRLERPE